MISIDRSSKQPFADQLVEQFSARIRGHELGQGTKLPSIRQLAQRIQVSVFTVVTAYDRLVARGLVRSRAGAGYFVSAAHIRTSPIREHSWPVPDSATRLLEQALTAESHQLAPGTGSVPAAWVVDAMPASVFKKVISRPGSIGVASPPTGTLLLREQVSAQLLQKGIVARPEEIVTTYGASHSFDLLCRAILNPGDAVLVEDPGYYVLHAQLLAHGMRLIPVPRCADGPDLDKLEELAKLHDARAFFTQTLLHNPTGANTSSFKCHRILSLAERLGFFIVEDDVYGDLTDAHAVRLAQLDDRSQVVYVSSFGKLFGPGVRLGYTLLPERLRGPFIQQKLMSVVTGSSLIELAVAEVLESGRYRHHVEAMRHRLARARLQALRQLSATGLTVPSAQGEGLFIWAELPGKMTGAGLVADAHAQGILLAQGSVFSPSGGATNFVRFCAPASLDPALYKFLESRLPAVPRAHLRVVASAS